MSTLLLGYFVAPDADDCPTLWAGSRDDFYPRAVVSKDQLRNDPAVWDALVAALDAPADDPLTREWNHDAAPAYTDHGVDLADHITATVEREAIAADIEALRPATFQTRAWQDGYAAGREAAVRVVRGGDTDAP